MQHTQIRQAVSHAEAQPGRQLPRNSPHLWEHAPVHANAHTPDLLRTHMRLLPCRAVRSACKEDLFVENKRLCW
jgi:hypothetical protein